MKRRRIGIQLLLIVAVALGALGATFVSGNEPLLGLDLQGGFSVVLEAKGDPPDDSVEKAKDIITQRVDSLGVGEPDITRQGKTVIVQLPGVKDRKEAQQVVGQTAKLEFRPVLADLQINAEAPAGDDPCRSDAAATTTTAPGAATTAPATAETTTTVAGGGDGGTTTTTVAGGGDGGTTTVPRTGTSLDGGDETGAPPADLVPGESASPAQLAPSTTAPPTTAAPTTAPPVTEPSTTAPVTTAPGDPTTDTVPGGEPGEPGQAGEGGQVAYPMQDRTSCVLLGPVGFEGTALSRAQAETNPNTGEWSVSVRIKGSDKDAANELFNVCNAGGATCPAGAGGQGRLAIALDEEVISAPAVQSPNLADDDFQITGEFTQDEAKQLEVVLRYGALPVEFVQLAENQVSATLGRDSLRAGLIAGAVGIAVVALYMLVYYRALGLVVILGLGVWAALMYSIVCLLSQTQGLALTLSGITGIIVSVGTTVDSYVVYFERLRDELRGGRTIRNATTRGFQQAFRTILTADVSSFIGAFLLWWLTVGPVRGFAFFLGLSTVLDVVVAYLFTRPAVILLGRNRFFTEARFFGIARGMRPVEPAPAAGAA